MAADIFQDLNIVILALSIDLRGLSIAISAGIVFIGLIITVNGSVPVLEEEIISNL